MTGETTIVDKNISISSTGGLLSRKNYSESYQHTKRNLMTPDECLRLEGARKNSSGEITRAGEMLIFVAGYPAIRGRQALYFQDKIFSSRASIPAPKTSDKIDVLKRLKPKKEETQETNENIESNESENKASD